MGFIELKNITYRYPLAMHPTLQNITCSFDKGKFYGIIGENGGGKTTLCNLIRGLIPHFYQGELTGEMKIDGTDIRNINVDMLSTRFGYIFQNPFTQISGIKETVFEEIAMGLENLGVLKKDMIERTVDVLKLCKIEHLAKLNPNHLSGGQRQKVAFASIIVMDSEVLVIDEPTSQLDPEGTADIFEIIHSLKNAGKTILLVEHKVDMVAEYADEVLVVERGKLIKTGTVQEVLSDAELLYHGAQIPQFALLGRDLGKSGLALETIPITKSQCRELILKKMGGNDNGRD